MAAEENKTKSSADECPLAVAFRYINTTRDVLNRKPSDIVAPLSSDLDSLRQIEADAKLMEGKFRLLKEEAARVGLELSKKLEGERYANPCVCHGCGKEFAVPAAKDDGGSVTLQSCFCFNKKNRKGLRLCSSCVDCRVAKTREKASKEGGLQKCLISESYAKCQKCGIFKCNSSACRKILDCYECMEVFVCVECAKEKESDFITCRCSFVSVCKRCKKKLMSKKVQEALEKEHSGADSFIDDECLVATTCSCRMCTRGQNKMQNGKRTHVGTGLVKKCRALNARNSFTKVILAKMEVHARFCVVLDVENGKKTTQPSALSVRKKRATMIGSAIVAVKQ
eukprot:CAMPEP_0172325516 /NCGR_PEP_ID=MMETSP1058-20130122/54253_1 /TAXON_ID=83371 /ORGANISM="Detonula confervacea, Strain CCMP 353" /LENGTH=338 /DNA_ID=CAMNT_0013042089 /DNA_START=107 /DNA_END=1121 /DNA_ORIENTATION=-